MPVSERTAEVTDRDWTAPLVSVVIPCYNQAHFLGEAIESVLAQTYRHYEIIVVDDGSPDTTSKVTSSYPAVRYLRQSNAGLSAARNAGMNVSRGQFLVFLDADDRLLEDALQLLPRSSGMRLRVGSLPAHQRGRVAEIAIPAERVEV
jgi:glycosyltransferase involved in cell wall biosynthesis